MKDVVVVVVVLIVIPSLFIVECLFWIGGATMK
jgi:hypothetical protein